jgi:hypothetical protein
MVDGDLSVMEIQMWKFYYLSLYEELVHDTQIDVMVSSINSWPSDAPCCKDKSSR